MVKKKSRRPVSPATLHRYIMWYLNDRDAVDSTGNDPYPGNLSVATLLEMLSADTVDEASRR